MEIEKLSDMEIKLINASRKFANKLNKKNNHDHRIIFEESISTGGSIKIVKLLKKNVANLEYSNNAEKGDFIIGYVHTPPSEIQKEYRNFLIKEIPEIADRIVYGKSIK